MNLILAGIGKLLVQLSAAFVVLGTAYLLLFAPNLDGPAPLPPEQVAANLAPIGRVRLAESPASTPAPTPAPTPASTSATVATEEPATAAISTTIPTATPTTTAANTVAATSEQPTNTVTGTAIGNRIGTGIGADTGETSAQAATTPRAIAAPADTPAEEPKSVETPVAATESGPPAPARAQASERSGAAAAVIQLSPDRHGMHGVYRLTPGGIILHPGAMIAPNNHPPAPDGIKGFFSVTPSGAAHFHLTPPPTVE